jgi:PTS system beta-glucosides-specific IIC component
VDDAELAARVGDLVGGPGNVRHVDVCASRLRFVVHDRGQVRTDDLEGTDGVVQVLQSGGQTQVVVGPNADEVYREIRALPGWAGLTDPAGVAELAPAPEPGEPPDPSPTHRRSLLDRVFTLLAGTFQPLIGPLLGASMVAMLLRLAAELGWYREGDDVPGVLLLTAASNAVFAFLPILVAITASRQLGASPFLAAAIVASLLDPSFLALGATGDVTDFFGLPLYAFSYSSSVLPALLVALALSVLEPWLRRRVPANVRLVVVPTVCLLVLVPLAALVFGPFGVLVGRGIADLLTWLDGVSPVLLSVTVAAGFLFLVMFGVHWALVPISLVNLEHLGGDPVLAAMGAYNFAVWGLAVGIVLRPRGDGLLRGIAGTGAASGLLGGISEPMLYGVILRYRRVIPIVVGAAALGGAVIGLLDVTASAVAFSSVFTIPLMVPTAGYLLGIGVSFGVALTAVVALGYRSAADPAPVTAPDEAPGSAAAPQPAPGVPAGPSAPVDAPLPQPAPGAQPERSATPGVVGVGSPLTGTVLPLGEVPDPMFATGLVGPGVAVLPSDGVVAAVADGTVVMAPPTGHAVGIRTGDGVEVLVHVGIGTVRLRGAGFRPRVRPGQAVQAGDVLVEVDLAELDRRGVPLLSPVVVTNAAAFASVGVAASGHVDRGEPLLTVTRRPGGDR